MSKNLNAMQLVRKSFNRLSKSEENQPQDTWPSIFLDTHYQQINIARLAHLSSLDLSLSGKRILELGAGVGDHTLYYLYQNCSILPVEGRSELVAFITKRFGITVKHADLEKDIALLKSESGYDIVHCYGLLYHLNNPKEFLENTANCGTTFLLETCVSSDFATDATNLVEEDQVNQTQAIHGVGCRPRRDWIWNTLKSLYPYVYCPKTQPTHEQFGLDWNRDFPIDQLQRAIFIASHVPILSDKLTSSLPKVYEKL